MNIKSIRFRLTLWYGALLALLLAAFSLAVYWGLDRYLRSMLIETLAAQSHQIGDEWLAGIATSGEDYLIDEIREHVSPENNNRFLRVTRADGSIVFQSDQPRDESFNPAAVSKVSISTDEGMRQERLPCGKELLIYSLPFHATGAGDFLIEVGASLSQINNTLHGLVIIFLATLPVAIAIAAVGGYGLMRRALRPVDEITRSAERISSLNLSQRLPVPATGDEIERLSATLNRMIARLEDSFKQITRFTADASHELRTPLTVVRGELEIALRNGQVPADIREAIESTLEETERLSKIVNDLMILSKLDSGQMQLEKSIFDLGELAASTTDQLTVLADEKQVSLSCSLRSQAKVEADRARIKQVLVNLIDNAIKYTPAGGRIEVSVRREDSNAIIEITDTGIGVPQEELPRIFDRFYRVDKARSRELGGSGLGLAISKSICEAHNGRIWVTSIPGSASTFSVELPAAEKEVS